MLCAHNLSIKKSPLRSLLLLVASIIAVAVTSPQSHAATIEVIHSTVPGHATAQVPGQPGEEFIKFWRPYRSPNGLYWGMKANADFFDDGQMVLLGDAGGNTEVVIIDGDAATWAPGEIVTNVDHQVGLDDDGEIVFGVNTDNNAGNDEFIMRWDGAFHVVVNEGDAVPGLAGVTFADSMLDAHILSDGTVCFRAINCDGLPSDSDTLLIRGSSVLVREQTTIPAGQAAGGTQGWDFFEFDGFYHSYDGLNYLIFGDLEGDTATDGVVVVNGNVVIQEGYPIPPLVIPVGSGFTGLREARMESNGDWFARGGNSDGRDFVVRNGSLLALTDDPVIPASSEHFDDTPPFTETFFMQAGNNLGQYVVGGTTDLADTNRDAVVVLNGTDVIVREGDRVDLNGNGLDDDDAFISEFDNDQSFLTDNRLVFTATLRNDAGTEIGQAIMQTCLAATVGDLNGDCEVNALDFPAIADCLTGPSGGILGGCDPANLDDDGDVDLADAAIFIEAVQTPLNVEVDAGTLASATASTGSYFSNGNDLAGSINATGVDPSALDIAWTVTASPPGSGTVTVFDPDQLNSQFVIAAPSVAGEYRFRLTVSSDHPPIEVSDTVILTLTE